jgi:2-polyprenyl-3-methyl-5-hydroxy-6-metoxy-1,4-benzoquinol methylase
MKEGMPNYVMDACVHHLSPGGMDAMFHEAANKLYRKWKSRNPLLPVIETTCARCRLQGGLKSILAYRIYRFKKKRRRKKVKKLLKMGADYRTLRHDVIGASYKITLSKMQIKTCDMRLSEKPTDYFEGDRREMLKYIPKGVKTTLEFGCGFGTFSALVKEGFGAETWAVEIDRNAANQAAKRVDKVINADASDAINKITDHYFDCIFFLDVLEHLADPYSLLLNLKNKLTREGVIIASIPNVKYYPNFIDFAIKGNWDYQDAGTLDKTHLMFFTYKSILKMFTHLNYEVLTIKGINATESKWLRFLNFLCLGSLEDLKYLQFVVVARPVDRNLGN